MKRVIAIIALFSSLCATMQAQHATLPLTLTEVEQLFLQRNIDLISERYNIDKAQAQIIQSRLFENPVITLEQNIYNRNNGRYFDIGPEGETIVEIEQVINLAGQRNKQVKLDKANYTTSFYQYEDLLRTLRSELNITFIELYFNEQTIEIFNKEIESIEQLLIGMREQQSKGNISLLELARIEAMLLSLRTEKASYENDIMELQNTLLLMLQLPNNQKIIPILNDTDLLNRLKEINPSLADIESHLLLRPDLKMSQSETEASKANLRLQRSMAAPEFAIKGVYDSAGDFINHYFAIGMSISIPIFNRNQGNIKSAKIELTQNNMREAYALEKAQSELYVAYNKLQRALNLYHSTDNKLSDEFDSLLAGINENFKKRNISMLEFIDYYETYKETSLQLHALKKEVFSAIENLNMTVGQTIIHY